MACSQVGTSGGFKSTQRARKLAAQYLAEKAMARATGCYSNHHLVYADLQVAELSSAEAGTGAAAGKSG